LEGSWLGPESGGLEGGGWTTGWNIAEVIFWNGGCGGGGKGAKGVGFDGVVMVVVIQLGSAANCCELSMPTISR